MKSLKQSIIKIVDLLLPSAFADICGVRAIGVDLLPIENAPEIILDREELTIEVFSDLAKIEAVFYLHNVDKECVIPIGFPVIKGTASGGWPPMDDTLYKFQVYLGDKSIQNIEKCSGVSPFQYWHSWEQKFSPGLTKIIVSYETPIIGYRARSSRPFTYVLRTGRFWKNNKIGDLKVNLKLSDNAELLLEDIAPKGYQYDLNSRTFSWKFQNWFPNQDISLILGSIAEGPERIARINHASDFYIGKKVIVHARYQGLLYDLREADYNTKIPFNLPKIKSAKEGIELKTNQSTKIYTYNLPTPAIEYPTFRWLRVKGTIVKDKQLCLDAQEIVEINFCNSFDGVDKEDLKNLYWASREDNFYEKETASKVKDFVEENEIQDAPSSISRAFIENREIKLLADLQKDPQNFELQKKLARFYRHTVQIEKLAKQLEKIAAIKTEEVQAFYKIAFESLPKPITAKEFHSRW